MTAAVVQHLRYGPSPEQFGELSLPASSANRYPVVILVHGGFWKAQYGLDLMQPLARDLVDRGVAVWNIEYRRVGQPGGGYPGTLADVAAAVDRLGDDDVDAPLDLGSVAIVGHSAGGHLALWAAGRGRLSDGDVGSLPRVRPGLAIGQAAVTDLYRAAADGLGANATQRFLGGEPVDAPDAYRVAQPAIGAVPTLLVTGDRDDDVPADYTRRFAARPEGSAVAVEVQVIDGENHLDVIDPSSRSWTAAVEAIVSFVGASDRISTMHHDGDRPDGGTDDG